MAFPMKVLSSKTLLLSSLRPCLNNSSQSLIRSWSDPKQCVESVSTQRIDEKWYPLLSSRVLAAMFLIPVFLPRFPSIYRADRAVQRRCSRKLRTRSRSSLIGARLPANIVSNSSDASLRIAATLSFVFISPCYVFGVLYSDSSKESEAIVLHFAERNRKGSEGRSNRTNSELCFCVLDNDRDRIQRVNGSFVSRW